VAKDNWVGPQNLPRWRAGLTRANGHAAGAPRGKYLVIHTLHAIMIPIYKIQIYKCLKISQKIC
jgi:hypothetical protein